MRILQKHYKNLRVKCKVIWMSKFIHGFKVSYRLIKMKASESSIPCIITLTHNEDLKTTFY